MPQAQIIAADDMWDISVTSVSATTDENGKAFMKLRSGSRYDVEAFVNIPDYSQAALSLSTWNQTKKPVALVLTLSHPFGTCSQFKKSTSRQNQGRP